MDSNNTLDCDEFFPDFIMESLEALSEVEEALLEIEENGANINLDLVNKVFRAVHSVKGAAGFLNLVTIGELSHSAENVLSLIRTGELVPTGQIVNELLQACDTLTSLVEDAKNSNGADVLAHVTALTTISENRGRSSVGQTASENQNSESTVDAVAPHSTVSSEKLNDCRRNGNEIYLLGFDLLDLVEYTTNPMYLIRRIEDVGEILEGRLDLENLPILGEAQPEQLLLGITVSTILDAEILQRFLQLPSENVIHIPEGSDLQTNEQADQLQSDLQNGPEKHSVDHGLEEKVSEGSEPLSKQTTTSKSKAAPKEANIRVSVSVIDRLMNLAGELVLGRNQLLQAIAHRDMTALELVGGEVDQITRGLQEMIMKTRMQQIGSVVNKFTRVVRDLSNTLNKQCRLVIEGSEVELDKTIIEAIGDPLTHLIRNAVDHGIESMEDRQKKGKDVVGTIVLNTYHQDGKVCVSIKDDGAGIDPERLKKKAIEKGFLTEQQANDLSKQEAVRLIAEPGLSTAEEVSAVSGRGVGMDVVFTNFEKLGGSVEIESEINEGTTITVQLPLTLAIIPSLIVSSGDVSFAIPQTNISELVRIRSKDTHNRIEHIKNAEVLRLRGALLPLVRLNKVLGIDEPVESDGSSDAESDQDLHANSAFNIVVVETGQLRYGLIVNTLNDSEEIVVKPLGRHMQNCTCLAGATVLGDGRVAMILDVSGIAEYEKLRPVQDKSGLENSECGSELKENISTLIFSNHPKEYFGIPMSDVVRIERIRAEQIDRVANRQVLQYRGGTLPLVALESTISAQPKVETAELFVIVLNIEDQQIGFLAPKIIDIREIASDLDSVTFQEKGIRGSTIIEGMTVRLIDSNGLIQKYYSDRFEGQTKLTSKTESASAVL